MSPKKLQAMKAKVFKELLDKYLAIEGHSVVSFAAELGVSRVSVHRWAGGARTIDRFTAEAIKKVFEKFEIS